MRSSPTYLSTIETSVFDLGHDVSLSSNVNTVGMGLVDSIASPGHDTDNRLHLGRLHLDI